MNNAEIIATIRAEIERRINELGISDESILLKAELSEILSFFSTLESEKPEADLEKEIEISIRLLNGLHTLEDNKSWYKGRYEELKELARNFYDLGCRRTAEKYDEIEYNRQRAEESEKPMNQENSHEAEENAALRKIDEEFIKQLSEKPMNQDELEKELDRYLHGEFQQTAGGNFNNYIQVARHFAKWGAEHYLKSEFLAEFAEMTGSIDTMPKNTLPSSKECEKGLREPFVSDDLEEAAEKYAGDSISDEGMMEVAAFIAGAKWQKEQIMSKAIEATLDNTAYPTRLWFNTYLSEYSNNDKVRVTIVKED